MINITIERKHLYLLAVIVVLAALLVPVSAWASNRFNDVPDSNTFHNDIAWLADAGVTKGCNPPTNDEFCPGDNVTREQMAAFMHRFSAIVLPGTTPPDGTTVRGHYGLLGNQILGPSTVELGDLSWGFEMPAFPQVHFLAAGAASTSDCPGSFGQPEAAEGHLCVYEHSAFNSGGVRLYSADGLANAASRFGALTELSPGGLGLFWSKGTWAVTAGTP